jgi:cation transport regulator ChaC
VVTLLEDPGGATCHGIAYRLGEETLAEVVHGLDFRERGGYARRRVSLHFPDAPSVQGEVYIATPENPSYLGEAAPDEIARQIHAAAGPSGPNVEYLLELARALRTLGAEDPHVFDLEARVNRLVAGSGLPAAR